MKEWKNERNIYIYDEKMRGLYSWKNDKKIYTLKDERVNEWNHINKLQNPKLEFLFDTSTP